MNNRIPRKTMGGLSAINLLISMALGMMIIAAIAITISATIKNHRLSSALAELHENGRYAINLLAKRLHMTGSLTGCRSGIVFKNILLSTPFHYDINNPIAGFESINADTWSPSINATGLTAGTNIGNFILPETDALLIRKKTGTAIPLALAMDDPMEDLVVIANITPTPFAAGDIVTVSDYGKCSLFQITGYNNSTGQVAHQIGLETPGNAEPIIADGGAIYDTTATISQLVTEIFYIGTGTDSEPTLYLKSGLSTGVEIIGGIENLQILYGEDLDGDLSADRYVAADAGINMANLVSVRVHLLARSKDEVNHALLSYNFMGTAITANDRRLRREFSTVIQLRNSG